MSQLLYRLGSFAAQRAWAVIGIWVLILAGIGGSYAAFKGEMSNEITIPGTEAQLVQEELADTFDMNTNAATGSAIVQTQDGNEFTEEQKAALASSLTRVGELETVDSVTNPFETAAQIADGQAKIEEGRAQLESGSRDIESGQAEIDRNRTAAEEGIAALDAAQTDVDAGKAQLEDAQRQLDEARAGLEASNAPAEAFGEIEAQQTALDQQRTPLEEAQAEIDRNRTEAEAGVKALDDAQAQLDQGRTDLETGTAELERNATLLDMTSDATSISEDGSTAIAGITFTKELTALSSEDLETVRSEMSTAAEDAGLKVTFDQTMQGVETHMNMTAEIIGVAIAFIILFIMLGTLVAAGLPILMALIGVGASALGTLALSGVIDMTSTTPTLGTMLGLAVGIDYTLFILNRHRNNLAQGMGIRPSIALATGTAGGAVVFAGITVMIALLGLNVVGIPFLSTMGNAAAFAVFIAVAVSVTFSPAVLSLIGWRLISKKHRAHLQKRAEQTASEDPSDAAASVRAEAHAAAQTHEEKKTGWIAAVLKKPLLTIAAVVLALGALSLPVADMRLGLPDGSSQPTDSAANISYNLIADTFGEGRNGTIIAAARLPEGTTEDEAAALQVDIGQDILEQEHVVSVIPALIAEDHSAVLYQVVPAEGPNSESTTALVHELRALTLDTDRGQVNFGVTGQTAMNIDISENLYRVLPIYVGIVIGLSLLVLVLVFRSILVPVTATIGFLFSLLAAMGATVAVFQWGWASELFGVSTPGPILSFLPILAVGILFGLAMDYQLFLVSGMKEAHSRGRGAQKAVVIGYQHGAKVVTAAALIMAGVFIGFVFSGDPMIASIGFILAAGVLFDAFLVRMTLIPALMYLLGERVWWIPSWLDKALPDLDVEGTKLEAEMTKAG